MFKGFQVGDQSGVEALFVCSRNEEPKPVRMMLVGLLISWATPVDNWPKAASLAAWSNYA